MTRFNMFYTNPEQTGEHMASRQVFFENIEFAPTDEIKIFCFIAYGSSFLTVTTLDRRQLVAGTHGPYKFDVILFYRQRTDVRLLPLFRQRFYKDTDIQTSKGNIATDHIKPHINTHRKFF